MQEAAGAGGQGSTVSGKLWGPLDGPQRWMHAPWSVRHHFHSLVLNLVGRAAPQTAHEQGQGIGRCGCALEGHRYSRAMAFGPPAAQPVIFVRLVLHLLSAKVEGDGCHLICCGRIVFVAAVSLSMCLCIDEFLPWRFAFQCATPQLSL